MFYNDWQWGRIRQQAEYLVFSGQDKEAAIKAQWQEITLEDGRRLWRDEDGRLRDGRGRWVKPPAKDIVPADKAVQEDAEEEESLTLAAQQAARRHMLQAVQQLGYPAQDPADAWGRLVGVQAEIAMDGQGGTKATSAAKFVAQATGLLDEEEDDGGQMDGLQLNIGAEAAQRLLDILVAIRGGLDGGE